MHVSGGGGASAVAAARAWFEVDAHTFDALADTFDAQRLIWDRASDAVAANFARLATGVTWEGMAAESSRAFEADQQALYADAVKTSTVAVERISEFTELLRAQQHLIDDALIDRERAASRKQNAERDVDTLSALDMPECMPRDDLEAAHREVTAANNALVDADSRLRDAARRLDAEDDALAAELDACAARMDALAAQQRGSRWLGSMTTPSMAMVLGAAQFQLSPAEFAYWEYVTMTDDSNLDPDVLRKFLFDVEPSRALVLVGAMPAVAEVLSRNRYTPGFLNRTWPPGSAEAKMFGAMAAHGGFPKDAQQVADYTSRTAEVWNSLTPAERARLIALYPGVVGTMRGITPADSFKANRVALAGAKHRADQLRASLGAHPHDAALYDPESGEGLKFSHLGSMGFDRDVEHHGWSTAGEAANFYRERSELYANMLDAKFDENPGDGSRQFLYFSPEEDGRATEVFGTFGSDARNVGIFIPGTGSSINDFHENNNVKSARGFLAPYDAARNAVILDIGFDEPNSVAPDTNAAMNHYSLDATSAVAATTLTVRRFAPDARSTIAGHSYGGAIVGVADSAGIPVDRVIHVSSAGAGKGVNSIDDIKQVDLQGMSRVDSQGRPIVDRYSLTPNKDLISKVQGNSIPYVDGVGHGADPDDLFTNVAPGKFHDDYHKPEFAGKDIDDPGTPLKDRLQELQWQVSKRQAANTWKELFGGNTEDPELERLIAERDKAWQAYKDALGKHPHVDTHKPGTDSADRIGDIMFDELPENAIRDRK